MRAPPVHIYGPPNHPLAFRTAHLERVDDEGRTTILSTDLGRLRLDLTPSQTRSKLSLGGVLRSDDGRMRVAIDPEDPERLVAIGYHNPRADTAVRAVVAKLCGVTEDVVDTWVLQGTSWLSSRTPKPVVMPACVKVFEGALCVLLRDGLKEDDGLHPFTLNDAAISVRKLADTICETLPGRPLDDVVRSDITAGLGLMIARVSGSGVWTHLHLHSEIAHLKDPEGRGELRAGPFRAP